MTSCPPLSSDGVMSVASVLRSVDCQTNIAVEAAFSRLFGNSGTLGQALTILLTLYVGLLAVNMLTGRSRLSVAMVTPRMLQLGLILTFATSWVAYQDVAWNLLARAPDELATLLLGTHGSATAIFAQRLDALFDVISQSAQLAQGANAVAPAPGTLMPQVGGVSAKAADLLWAASLLLLLGTVGVLVVARIALAALMALGPVFIVTALFQGTRGLFEGWLKSATAFALTPIFAVLLGGATVTAMTPMINALAQSGGKIPIGLATSIFLGACVYIALMVMAARAARMLTSGWTLPHAADVEARDVHSAGTGYGAHLGGQVYAPAAPRAATPQRDPRLQDIVSAAQEVSVRAYMPATLAAPAVGAERGALNLSDPNSGARDPRLRPISMAAREDLGGVV